MDHPAEQRTASPRERLLVTAERLIAERGAAVPLQEIVEAAGQRNRSAIGYHFGSREGLVTAILERRLSQLADRQVELLLDHERSGRPDDVPALTDILVRPMFEVPYADGSTHYASFLEQVRHLPEVTVRLLDEARWPVVSIVTHRLHRALGDLAPDERQRRMGALTTVMAGLIADLEHDAHTRGVPMRTDEAIVAATVGSIVAVLTAPIPPAG